MRLARSAMSLVIIALTASACSRGTTQPVTTPPALTATETAPAPAAPDTAKAAAAVKKADTLMVAGDYKQGVTVLLETLGAFPDYAPAWDLLTFGYNRLELYQAARMAALRSIALDPKPAGAQFNAGYALAFTRMGADTYSAAARHLETAANGNKQPYTFYLLSAVLQASGKAEEARATLHRALGYFPENKDLKRALAAMTTDLDVDGKPEQIFTDKGVVRVLSGATGSELLKWEAPQPNVFTTVIDIGGEVPVLVADTPPFYATVFGWNGKALTNWGQAGGVVSPDPVARRLVAGTIDQTMGVSRRHHFRTEGGKLKSIKTTTIPLKGSVTPPTDLVVLNEELNGSYPPAAFTTPAQATSLEEKLKPFHLLSTRGIVLLPEPGGTYRLEIHVEGAVKATARATVVSDGKTFLIQELVWK